MNRREGNWEGMGGGVSSEGESNLTAPAQAKDDLGSALGKKGLGCQVGQWWIFFSPNKGCSLALLWPPGFPVRY